MTGTSPAGGRHTGFAGHNRISTQALTSTARAVAAEVFGVPASQVRANWSDDQGLLALELSLPVGIPPLTRIVREPDAATALGGSMWDRAHTARGVILEGVARLTGSQLSRVDIRITGVRIREGDRIK